MGVIADVFATAAYWIGRGGLRLRWTTVSCSLFAVGHRISPDHIGALRYRAWCLAEAGELQSAVALYRRLLDRRPTFIEGRIELGFVLSRLNRYSDALEQFDRALEESPADSRTRRGSAAMLLELRHFAEAIPLCRALTTLDSTDSVAWGMLARAHAGAGEWEDAILAYEKAQAVVTDSWVAAEHAAALMELNRLTEAEAVLKAALATGGSGAPLSAQLAQVLAAQDRLTDAEALLRAVLSENPSSRQAKNVLAMVLADRGDIETATRMANDLIAEYPDDASAQGALGWVAIKGGLFEKARAAFEVASDLEPGRPAFIAGLATAMYRLGLYAEARTATRAIVERDPTYFLRHREWAELTALLNERHSSTDR